MPLSQHEAPTRRVLDFPHKGDADIGEPGLIFKPSKDLPQSFDLGAQGCVGKREGVTGSLQIRHEF